MQQLLAHLLRAHSCHSSYDKNTYDSHCLRYTSRNQDSSLHSCTDALFPACETFFSSVKSSQQAPEQLIACQSMESQMKWETWLKASSHQREKNLNPHTLDKILVPVYLAKASLCTFPYGRQLDVQRLNQVVVLNTLSEQSCQNQLPGRKTIYESCLGFGVNWC